MGYTLHFREMNEQLTQEQMDIGNSLYQTLLTNIIHPESQLNLLDIFNRRSDVHLFEECFHEWQTGTEGQPTLFSKSKSDWGFCKTARKIYDLAVYATLKTVHDAYGIGFSSDGDTESYPRIIDYATAELEIDKFKYDYSKLEDICDKYFDKLSMITYSEEPYTSIADISDVDFEYIAQNIRDGNTTIYLDNGTVVKLIID